MDSQHIPSRTYFWYPLHGRRRPGRPKTSWRSRYHTEGYHIQLNLGWSVEEAEVAPKDRRIWKFISRQAAGAGMPDAIQCNSSRSSGSGSGSSSGSSRSIEVVLE